jgi:hypothetical protein
MSFEEAREQIYKALKKPLPVAEPDIAFSYHNKIIGKPERRIGADGKPHLWMGDQQVNLGYGWRTVKLPYNELFMMLSEGGYALAPALKTDHRDKGNFVSHALALVDIDDGMRVSDLPNNSFYQKYGSGYYTTPSHTQAQHKFRIIYRLEQPITDAEEMRALYEGLLALHGAADISCKDPARLFFGTVKAASKEITGRILTVAGVQEALAKRAEVLTVRAVAPATVQPDTYPPPTIADVRELLDELRKHFPDLKYKNRFNVTRAAAAAVGLPHAIYEMRTRWSDADKTAKYEDLLKDPLLPDGPMLGSVVYMIRDKDPLFRTPQPKVDIKPMTLKEQVIAKLGHKERVKEIYQSLAAQCGHPDLDRTIIELRNKINGSKN